ncbi:MAG: hypothetical protein UX76_C0002G0032 [Candidatus Wolfebacteria bacterium GW2011_GWC1_47_103]|nr:MAG: hypothetical protein UX76_C0002G0032 [Candidatus Wolfebacteria bacterium GW2011_GWC1_47_103]
MSCRKIFAILSVMDINILLKEYLDYLEIEKNRSKKTGENYGRYLREAINITSQHKATI